MIKRNNFIFNKFLDAMMSYINVFGMYMLHISIWDVDNTHVVTV